MTTWIRAPRGAVRHMAVTVFATIGPLCEYMLTQPYQWRYTLDGDPVCRNCRKRIEDAHREVMADRAQESFVTGEVAAPNEYGAPSDAELEAMLKGDQP